MRLGAVLPQFLLDTTGNSSSREWIAWKRRGIAFLVLADLCLCVSALFVLGPRAHGTNAGGFAEQSGKLPKSEPGRAKIAEGEYAVVEKGNFGAAGPFGEEVYDFHETWTIWHTGSGEYEVEGKREFESPKGSPHDNSFLDFITMSAPSTRVDFGCMTTKAREEGAEHGDYRRGLSPERSV
ncbi:MAG: hypothetical protein ACLP3K_00650, partial [Candidatus Acidiferrales bacterium]